MTDRFAPNSFETFKTHSPRRPYGETAKNGVPFPIYDPFCLRKAVVPVFLRYPDGRAVGVGTAFHVDGWGRLLTADHVVDHLRALHLDQIAPDALIEVDIRRSTHAAVLLGYGRIFGTVDIPEACWAPIGRVDAIVVERNEDPLGALQGKSSSYQIGPDVAGMSSILHPDSPPFHALSVNFQAHPEVGEVVFAVGYPELGLEETLNGSDTAHYLQEGMCGVFGQVTCLHPNGRDRTRPTPGFEVEANWPSGMSGGPIFNQRGEVVGVVSSSLPPGEIGPGIGYAASFSMTPNVSQLTATLDVGNPGRRLGFGVFRTDPWHLAEVFR